MGDREAESRLPSQERLGLLENGEKDGLHHLEQDSENESAAKKEKAAAANAMASCLMYVGCSTMMVLTNKWLASSLDVQAHISLLVMQNAVATLLVAALRALGIVHYPPFDVRVALQWLPVDMFFIVMLSTSFEAMRFLSVPMITVFKQLANLLTVTGEYVFFGKGITYGVLFSFAVMIFGALLAAANDLAFSLAGYAWQVANCFSTSGYVLYLKHATQSIELTKFGMVFYNNLLSIPLLGLIAIAHNEPAALLDAHYRGAINTNFFLVNAFAGSLGLLLNLSSVWCVSATSATTYAVVGALNKIPSTVLGFLLFDTIITKEMAVYICISLLGGFMYSYEKLRQSRPARN